MQTNINNSGTNCLPPDANVSTDDLATSRSTAIGATDTVELNNGYAGNVNTLTKLQLRVLRLGQSQVLIGRAQHWIDNIGTAVTIT